MFKRKVYNELLEWKEKYADRSACLLEGARRVGKSTIALEFAKNEYESFIFKLLFCKWVVIIRLFTVLRAHCIPISHFFWRQNCQFYKF